MRYIMCTHFTQLKALIPDILPQMTYTAFFQSLSQQQSLISATDWEVFFKKGRGLRVLVDCHQQRSLFFSSGPHYADVPGVFCMAESLCGVLSVEG